MPVYIAPRGGPLAIFICPRCKMKRRYVDMVMDEDTKQMVCSFGCADLPDPYLEPAPKPDIINLKYPRPEEPLE